MTPNPALRILVWTKWYLPGFKAGGSVRSVANMVESLSGEYSFNVVALDRDFGDVQPYPNLQRGGWQANPCESVLYLSNRDLSIPRARQILQSHHYDVLYFNSLFAPWFTTLPLLLLKLRLTPRVPVIVAPRGELSPGAVKLKGGKKHLFLAAAKFLGLYRDVVWQASGKNEQEDIQRTFGSNVRIAIAPDIAKPLPRSQTHPGKIPGSLNLVFVSRIHPKKNLLSAFSMLAGLRGQIRFDLYGLIEDQAYWSECQSLIARLPANITAEYRGLIQPDQVAQVMTQSDAFFMPTLGENFGHVILEALSAGCPVLISDQTPWRELEQSGVGWDIPLSETERFQSILQMLTDMDAAAHRELSQAARQYGLEHLQDESVIEQNRQMFQYAASQSPSQADKMLQTNEDPG